MSALPAPANRLIDNPGSRRAAPEEIRNRFITAGRAFKRNPKHVNAAVLRRQECHLPGFLPGKSLKPGIVFIRILFFIFPPSFDGIRSVKRRSASQIILEAPGGRQAHFHEVKKFSTPPRPAWETKRMNPSFRKGGMTKKRRTPRLTRRRGGCPESTWKATNGPARRCGRS